MPTTPVVIVCAETELNHPDFILHHLAVLQTVYLNCAWHDDYKGVIATSHRAAVGLHRAIQHHPLLMQRYQEMTWFCVGDKTANTCRELFQPDCILGQESGHAAALGQVILDHRLSGPLLFITGDKTRPTLPRLLQQHQIPFHQVQVYETHPHPEIGMHLITYLNQYHITFCDSIDRDVWFLLFSPSGADIVLGHLKNILGKEFQRRVKFASIGPTTTQHLQHMGIEPLIEAQQPNPEGIWKAFELYYNL